MAGRRRTGTERKDGRIQESYTGRDGKRKFVYGKNRTEARDKKRAALNAIQQGRVVGDYAKRPLRDWLNHWCDDVQKHSVTARTHTAYRTRLGSVVPLIGPIPLGELTGPQIEEAYAKLRAKAAAGEIKMSETTLAAIHRALSSALRTAVLQDEILRNPADKVAKPPRETSRDIRPLSMGELRRLLDAAASEPYWQAMWAFLAGTGLRFGEMAGLRWENLDLEKGEVRVRKQAVTSGPGDPVEDDLKTKGSRRDVPLIALVRDVLIRHRDRERQRHLSPLVFPNRKGTYLRNTTVRVIFKRHLAAAGLPDIRIHDLRHTAASLWLVDLRWPVSIVSPLLGHTKPATTLNVYSHLLPGKAAEVIGEFDTLWRAHDIDALWKEA